MPRLKTITITNIIEFVREVDAFARTGDERGVWYRGCGSATFRLVPSLYRHPTVVTIEELLELERKILDRFKQRSIPFTTQRPPDDWEALFFMQHYGVPTRLLDWSESPYIALYFALTDALHGNRLKIRLESPLLPEDAVIWSLRPGDWNKAVLHDIKLEPKVLLPNDGPVESYGPGKTDNLTAMRIRPICIYGTHNSQRIVAQRGVFVIFGKSKEPLESAYEERDFQDGTLQRYLVPAANIETLLASLQRLAFTDSVVFPDLHGMGLEMKHFYGFGQ